MEVMENLSQLMNGLFTVGAAINFPSRMAEAYILYAKSDVQLNALFPRQYAEKGNRIRIIVVSLLLLNCLAQIPITCVHLFYHTSLRPQWVVPVFLPVCFGSATIAALVHKKNSILDTSHEFQTVVELS